MPQAKGKGRGKSKKGTSKTESKSKKKKIGRTTKKKKEIDTKTFEPPQVKPQESKLKKKKSSKEKQHPVYSEDEFEDSTCSDDSVVQPKTVKEAVKQINENLGKFNSLTVSGFKAMGIGTVDQLLSLNASVVANAKEWDLVQASAIQDWIDFHKKKNKS